MAGKHYVGEIGTDIIVDCGSDITGATETEIKVKKPDGTEVAWDADIEGTDHLKYTTILGDFDQAGKYYLQSSMVLPAWQGLGETVHFDINMAYN